MLKNNTDKLNLIIENAKKVITKEIKNNISINDFKGKNIMTVGTFDLFHEGHKKIIDHSKEIAEDTGKLIIAVSSDDWNELKGKNSKEDQEVRVSVVKEKYPNAIVILEDHKSAEESWGEMFDKYDVDLIVMGGDHCETLEYINNELTPNGRKMKIAFFERTPEISTTLIKKLID